MSVAGTQDLGFPVRGKDNLGPVQGRLYRSVVLHSPSREQGIRGFGAEWRSWSRVRGRFLCQRMRLRWWQWETSSQATSAVWVRGHQVLRLGNTDAPAMAVISGFPGCPGLLTRERLRESTAVRKALRTVGSVSCGRDPGLGSRFAQWQVPLRWSISCTL